MKEYAGARLHYKYETSLYTGRFDCADSSRQTSRAEVFGSWTSSPWLAKGSQRNLDEATGPGCQQRGHLRRDCPVKPCVWCKAEGHMVKTARQRPLFVLRLQSPPFTSSQYKRRRTLRDV